VNVKVIRSRLFNDFKIDCTCSGRVKGKSFAGFLQLCSRIHLSGRSQKLIRRIFAAVSALRKAGSTSAANSRTCRLWPDSPISSGQERTAG